MTESPLPFNQSAFEEGLVQAAQDQQLLDWLTTNQLYRHNEHYAEFRQALINAHNSEKLNLLSSALSEPLRGEGQLDFWMLQDLLVSIIPELSTHPDLLMDVIIRLIDEGGNWSAPPEWSTRFISPAVPT